jgi:sugar phosphate isomerase/epimerase
MDKHWSHYCTMSIVHFMAFPQVMEREEAIIETIERIAQDDFFDAVEVAPIENQTIRTHVSRVVEISQLQLAFCAHPAILSNRLNINSSDVNERLEAVERLKSLMNQARELGAGRFAFLSGPDPGDAERSEALRLLIDSLNKLCESGQEIGISLALEPFDRAVDKNALIGPVEDAARVAHAVSASYPNFGLLYDMSHMPLLDETPTHMTLVKEHLVHAHVGNCVKVKGRLLYGDLHPYLGFPGGVSGVKELAAFVRALFEIGFLAEGKYPKPWVGFEVKPQGPGETPELIVANCRRLWRQAWAQV